MVENECLSLKEREASEQKKIMEVLLSSVKIRILEYLSKHPEGLGAKEIAEYLGVTLPTTLEHLDLLVSSGLVERKGGVLKGRRYFLKYKCVEFKIDIPSYAKIGLEKINIMAKKFIEGMLEKKRLTLPVSVREISKTLGIDRSTAAQVAAIINRDPTVLTAVLEPYIVGILGSQQKKTMTISELARKLGADPSTIALVVMELAERGIIYVDHTGIRLIENLE